ncbi:MAG: hypothetical protein J7495_07760 [Sphingomonas sp.]|nr:hypothetical protein [Sphingomonas sp.]
MSGFDLGFGDRGDSIIAISILEHWRNVFMGVGQWNLPLYFHPHPDTLGYNDGYLLHGLIYSAWRLGFDPFRADTLTGATLETIGFAGAFVLASRTLRWGVATATLLALLFSISNNMYVGAGHIQIRSLALLPWLAIAAIGAWRSEMAGDVWRARRRAIAAVAIIGLWLVTSFYFVWFALYFSLVLLLCWAGVTRRMNLRGLAVLNGHWGTIAVTAAAFALAILPFLAVYVPKLAETGGYGYKLSYLIHPTDLINVGPGNLLWGWLIAGLRFLFGNGQLAEAVFGNEHQSGFPLFLFALACTAAWPLVRRRGDASFLRAFALAIVISWAFTLRFGPVSLWGLVYWLVPGARGLRVVLRYQLFLLLPLLLLVAAVHRTRLAALLGNHRALALGIVALLVIEQINFAPTARMSRREQLAALEPIPTPPPGCKSFVVTATRVGEPMFRDARLDALYPHNVDAMYLAQRWRVPTVNGMSSFNPPDWDFADPEAPDYPARITAYAGKHGLAGLCRLDVRATPVWTRLR